MRQNSGRTLPYGSSHLAYPYADAFAHVARRELKPLVSPIRLAGGVMETRLAIQVVQIGTDELAVFHADAGIIDQIGDAAGGIDLDNRDCRGCVFSPR